MPRIKGWDKITKKKWINYRGYGRADEVKLEIERIYSRIDKKSYYAVVRYEKLWNEPWHYAKRKELGRFKIKSVALKFAINWMKKHPGG